MLTRWLTNLESVHQATTREQRDAVYRFRYKVYVEELGREIGGADHQRKIVRDEDDEKDFSLHLYTGSVDDMTGTVRVRIWHPGQVPDYDFEMFSMDRFPEIGRRSVSELGRLMVRPTMRGKLVLPAIARAVYERSAEAGCDFAFCYCAPGLVQHYRKLGFRPYAAPLIPTVDGMHVALVAVLSDSAYLRRMGSPVAGLASKYFGRGKRKAVDLAEMAELLDVQGSPIELDPDKVWDQVQEEFLGDAAGSSSFLDSLSDQAVKKLTAKGFVIDVDKDTLITKEGYGEREMFIVIDGTLQVLGRDGRRVAVLGRGDLFGELAFFREEGRRSASVQAVSDCRLLMLRRRFIKELEKSDPELAVEILMNLGRVLSDRFVRSEALWAVTS